ncbi:hypothetical protein SIM22_04965 [Bacillus cereus group sp. BfR-BA-01363]|uniref:hypothetical protein n=1 Tax=Bacillus cereus group sp. BfR-BA-01363 TaxID=3094882 RepID=UPI0029C465A7|nr:hypothetical protein [Bacillus cereus group sp. BfR-BA-01363]MDX5853482.1 hypothetical protein [Bacillus cereus group sp. BfR-BA-01363]
MRTKLKEGQVVKCINFIRGNLKEDIIFVGDYDDEWIYERFLYEYAHGKPYIDDKRAEIEYLILNVNEEPPRKIIGNRTTSYENRILAIELNDDGTYDENNQKISFTTAGCFIGAIKEDNIKIVAEMKKVYVRQEL